MWAHIESYASKRACGVVDVDTARTTRSALQIIVISYWFQSIGCPFESFRLRFPRRSKVYRPRIVVPKPKSSFISAVGWRSASVPTLLWPAPHTSLVTDGAAAVSSAARTLSVVTRELDIVATLSDWDMTASVVAIGGAAHHLSRSQRPDPRHHVRRSRRVQRWGRGTIFVRGMTDK